jgi:type I restriction enzyme S subunit
MTNAFKEATIEQVCNVEYGTRVVRKKDAGTIYPVYGGGGETFFLDTFNREDRVVVARFAMSEKCTRRVNGKFALNDSGLTLSPKDQSMLRQDYLDYFVLSLNDQIYGCARGTAQKNLDVPTFRQMKVFYPESVDKQQEIVKKLDRAFAELDLVVQNQLLNDEKANQLFKSLLNSSFNSKKVSEEPNNHKSLERISMIWREVSLKELCEVDWGNTKLTKSSYVDGGKFLAVSAAGADGRIDHYEHESNVAVLSAIGAQCGRMFYPGAKFTAIKNTITLTPKINMAYGKFLYYLFTHVELPQRGAGQPFISKGDIEAFRVSVPIGLDEQVMIVEKLDSAFADIELLKAQLKSKKDYIAALRQSLLSSAFTPEEVVA